MLPSVLYEVYNIIYTNINTSKVHVHITNYERFLLLMFVRLARKIFIAVARILDIACNCRSRRSVRTKHN
jgi:hypothetical protein